VTYMIEIGRRTGLFDAAAAGPATSHELAARAGLHERYVREWVGAMVTAGVLEHDADNAASWLAPQHAASLTGRSATNIAALAMFTTDLARHVPAVAESFRTGGGVPFDAFLPEMHVAMDELWGPMYDELLIEAIVPLAPGLHELLDAGARVAEIACGSGNALTVLARAYPRSTFVGIDIDPTGIARARARTRELELTNVEYVVADAAETVIEPAVDAIFVFNAIHDQVSPSNVLANIRDSLVPGGVFVMDEPAISSDLADNVDNPMAPFTYAVSTLHCLTVSLAHGGAGLGTAWGRQTAQSMLADAGFGAVAVHEAPGDPGNAIFVTHRPHGA
ncbi:MAG TPA: methyltransferase domain-containing protein, partial [Ilumatobacteraceae bacterium]